MPSIKPGELFIEAFRAVHRTASALVLYLTITAAGTLVFIVLRALIPRGDEDAAPTLAMSLIEMGLDVFMAGVGALAATLAFSRMGRELDKPLWKVDGDLDALRRFYPLWLILALCASLLRQLLMIAAPAVDEPLLGTVMLLAYIVLMVLIIPVGACIMFRGRVAWASLGESLEPLGRQFAYAFGVLLFGFAAYLTVFIAAVSYPHAPGFANWDEGMATGVFLILELIAAYCDCVVFAGIWLICRMHRDTYQDDEDDFEF